MWWKDGRTVGLGGDVVCLGVLMMVVELGEILLERGGKTPRAGVGGVLTMEGCGQGERARMD